MDRASKNNKKDYHISFFRPTTPLAKFNRNLSIVLVTVWAISIFGFQVLLKVIEQPTPEIAYIQYEKVWNQIKNDQATVAEKQVFIKSALSVLGKVTIKPEDRVYLDNAIYKMTLDLASEDLQSEIDSKILAFKEVQVGDAAYENLKKDLGSNAAKYINVESYSLEAKLIPLELVNASSNIINYELIEIIMPRYLIHNQSFLTDFVFLGFPFHYFYTAVFLLILFVLICWYYCVVTDRAMIRLGVEEE